MLASCDGLFKKRHTCSVRYCRCRVSERLAVAAQAPPYLPSAEAGVYLFISQQAVPQPVFITGDVEAVSYRRVGATSTHYESRRQGRFRG